MIRIIIGLRNDAARSRGPSTGSQARTGRVACLAFGAGALLILASNSAGRESGQLRVQNKERTLTATCLSGLVTTARAAVVGGPQTLVASQWRQVISVQVSARQHTNGPTANERASERGQKPKVKRRAETAALHCKTSAVRLSSFGHLALSALSD